MLIYHIVLPCPTLDKPDLTERNRVETKSGMTVEAFFKQQELRSSAMLATIKLSNIDDRIEISPWQKRGCGCSSGFQVPKSAIKQVSPTGEIHVCCDGHSQQVVEILFNEDATAWADIFHQVVQRMATSRAAAHQHAAEKPPSDSLDPRTSGGGSTVAARKQLFAARAQLTRVRSVERFPGQADPAGPSIRTSRLDAGAPELNGLRPVFCVDNWWGTTDCCAGTYCCHWDWNDNVTCG